MLKQDRENAPESLSVSAHLFPNAHESKQVGHSVTVSSVRCSSSSQLSQVSAVKSSSIDAACENLNM